MLAGADGLPTPNYSAYGATKAGILQLTRTLEQEARDSGAHVHMLSPGVHALHQVHMLSPGALALHQVCMLSPGVHALTRCTCSHQVCMLSPVVHALTRCVCSH